MLPPLRFEPIFKSALWGGRRLASMLPGAPADGPIGEAWVLSDQGDSVSRVADGPLAGTTLRELMRDRCAELLGPAAAKHAAFPLLLKFIDAREPLSVQVHPDDNRARTVAGADRGKTEAWYILSAEPGSRIYAGLKPGVDEAALRRAVADGTVAQRVHSFEPKAGDCVYLPAGIVHALGGGVTIFEVQQTSDVTYRLDDWNRVDAKTGRPRELHVESAIACTDFAAGAVDPVTPVTEPGGGESHQLVRCPYFVLRRFSASTSISISTGECRILIGLEGTADLNYGDAAVAIRPFDVYLLPAGRHVSLHPHGRVTLLDCRPT